MDHVPNMTKYVVYYLTFFEKYTIYGIIMWYLYM